MRKAKTLMILGLLGLIVSCYVIPVEFTRLIIGLFMTSILACAAGRTAYEYHEGIKIVRLV
jgi:hypothetical protein